MDSKMISIAIIAFKEEKSVAKTIESIIKQKIPGKYELVVCAPDEGTISIAKKYKHVKIFKDPGEGKNQALNLLYKTLKGDIWIFTDGDVILGDGSVAEILKPFENSKIGLVSGRVVAFNSRETKYGYWAHLLSDAGAHEERLRGAKIGFVEPTGYLMAFRANLAHEIPLEVADDASLPFIARRNNYKSTYAPEAVVYVMQPENFREWVTQKKRCSISHEDLDSLYPEAKELRVKTFGNELLRGTARALRYSKSLKELVWTFELFAARLYMWLVVYYDRRFKGARYTYNWEKIRSSKV
ncbi:MAG: glycosyltransferase [archaeon]